MDHCFSCGRPSRVRNHLIGFIVLVLCRLGSGTGNRKVCLMNPHDIFFFFFESVNLIYLNVYSNLRPNVMVRTENSDYRYSIMCSHG